MSMSLTPLYVERRNDLDVRKEAIRWEQEGQHSETRGRSCPVPSFCAIQCSQGRGGVEVTPGTGVQDDMAELKETLTKQQEQINQLSHIVVPRWGLLVVKDLLGSLLQRKVPGVLGMNVIGEWYEEIFRQHDVAPFDLPAVNTTISPWFQAFQHFLNVQVESGPPKTGMVTVHGRGPVCIPAGTLRVISATCPQGQICLTLIQDSLSHLRPNVLSQ